jgi:type IV secretion system protein TrbL
MTTAAFKAARKPPARAAARLQAPLRVARRPIVKTATAAALPVARLRGGEASSASSQGEGAPESGDTGGTQRTGLSRAAKTASILGGAAAGMAVGALKERVGNTVGGRLAANIRASAASASSGSETLAPATGAGSPASSSDSSPPPTAQFAGDTISAARDAGDMETPEDEVAAFVQRRGTANHGR